MPLLETVPMSLLPPGMPFTDHVTGASVFNCMVWVTRRLLPPAEMADSFSIWASLRLKPQPAVKTLRAVRQSAAALPCHLVGKLAVHIRAPHLDRTKLGRLTAGKRDACRSDSLKVPKRGLQGNGTFEVVCRPPTGRSAVKPAGSLAESE